MGFSTVRVDPAYPKQMQRRLSGIDVAFLALHGQGGEDGTIQRELERRKIPYIGSDAEGSWRAFDKRVSKQIFKKFKIPTPKFVVINRLNWKSRLTKFPVPFVVKPLCDGSSVGILMVEDFAKEAEKIKKALRRYPELLVEEKIVGREFTVGILGKQALPVIELVTKRAFYDYRAKYTPGMTEYLAPAPVSKKFCAKLQKLALAVHKSLGLRDFSRVDIMADQAGIPYVLEANSIPGFTELSLLPKAARAAGISFEEVCYRLISWAHKRGMKNSDRKGICANGKEKT
jgi:D-alanine-D-alanine ligase